MQYHRVNAGATGIILPFEVWDSTNACGARLGGLVAASSGLTCYYDRIGASGAPVAVTLSSGTKGTYTSSAFIAKGTGMSGTYDLCVPDAALATGAKAVDFFLQGAAAMVPVAIHVELDSNFDASGNLVGNVEGNVSGAVGSVNGSAMRGTDAAYTGTPPTASAVAVETTTVMDASSSRLTTIAADVDGLNGSGFTSVTLACGVTVSAIAEGAITASAIATDAFGSLELAASAAAEIGAASASGMTGPGASHVTITVRTTGGTAIADAHAWVTSDLAGTTTVVAGTTNSAGRLVPLGTTHTYTMLDAGTTYYLWAAKDGTTFVQGSSFTATAD